MWRRLTSKKLDAAESSSWTLGVVNFSMKVLGRWDTCHYPDEGQILTTTDAPHSPLVESEEKKSGLQRYSGWMHKNSS